MLYQKNNLILFLLPFLFLFNINECQKQQTKYGSLLGNAVFVDAEEKENLGAAREVIIELKHKGKSIQITSDESSIIAEKLSTGNYCLSSAKTKEGISLSFSPNQSKCFEIKVNKIKRFDVMLLKPSGLISTS